MKIEGKNLEADGVLEVARLMAIAARTAPKGKGCDNLECFVLTKEDYKPLIDEMKRIAQKYDRAGFSRDAESLSGVPCIFFIGTKLDRLGLGEACGFCGYKDCDDNRAHNGICIYNPNDLGIAVGSAVSVAADHRVDTRIMYSAGRAAINIGLFHVDVKIAFAIPLSVSGKNPFFDRKPK
jgi:uncharacterized ferredoxin-like protein